MNTETAPVADTPEGAASALNVGLGATPIFKDGEIPKSLCVNHWFQGYVDLKHGKRWMKCYFCGEFVPNADVTGLPERSVGKSELT